MRRSQVPSLKKQKLSNQAPGGDATFRSTASSALNSSQSGVRPSSNRPVSSSFAKPADVPAANQSKSESTYQVFSVVFGAYKPNKKHKEWNDDAILVLEGKSIRVYNLEGDK